MNVLDTETWSVNWAWSLPLIAMNLVLHVLALGFITEEVDRILRGLTTRRRSSLMFAVVMGVTGTLATILHGLEAGIWAVAYRLLGAFASTKPAMLYSLSAMTTYGGSNASLPDQWRLMGALEALNGMLLFGLTTAFLFAMIQKVRLFGSGGVHRPF